MHTDLVESLAAAPGVVTHILTTTTVAPPPGEWSVEEIFGHIRAADTIWSNRILLALVHDGVAVPDVDERRLQDVQASAGLSVEHDTAAWTIAREELVGVLRALPGDAWLRTCVHATAGTISVLDCVRNMVEHELEHLDQLRATAQ